MFSNINMKRDRFITTPDGERVMLHEKEHRPIGELYFETTEGYLHVYQSYIGLYDSMNPTDRFRTIDISDLIFNKELKDEILLFTSSCYEKTKDKKLGRNPLKRYRIKRLCLKVIENLKEI